MSDPITVVSYDPAWPETFRQLGAQLRAGLGGLALRIDHIGSTAVPGLTAKPIVDIQVSVERLEPVEPFRSPLEAAGFAYWAANTERTKRYFREPPGQRRTHVHVRRAASPSSSPCCSGTFFGRSLSGPGLWPTQGGAGGTVHG